MLWCNPQVVLLATGDPYVGANSRTVMSNYFHSDQPPYDTYPDYPHNVPYPSQYTSGQPETLGTNDVFYSAGRLAPEESIVGDAAERPADGARDRIRHKYGSDHVKHRRTRSGCLTCRLRRVKVNTDREMLTSFIDTYCR